MLPYQLYKVKLYPYYCIFVLFFINTSLFSQGINLRFQHLTSDNGLSQNTVDCILKDSRGYMWFGTWNGLNRFDGYSFVVYKSENNPNSLSNNFIYSICEDKEGNLWIGTKYGLNVFTYALNKFTRYFQESDTLNGLPDNTILSLMCDNSGQIFVGTSKGLCAISKENNKENYIFKEIQNIGKFNLNKTPVNSVIQDKQGNYWIGTGDGLYVTDSLFKTARRFQNSPSNSNSLTYNQINVVYEDRYGKIWAGTQFGLNRLDPLTNNVERWYSNPDFPKSLSHFVVNDIKEDLSGNLLIATLGGLNKYNPAHNNFDHFPTNLDNDYSLNNEFVNSLFVDKKGNIWIGTDKGGVNKYSIYQKQFGFLVHEAANPNSLSNNTVNSVYDEGPVLWIGTAGGGLNQYDKKTQKFKFYIADSHIPQGINNNFITTIHRDKSKNLWIGTWGGGLNKMVSPSGNGIFKKYITTSDPNSICDVYVSSIWEDEAGFLLVGNLGGLDIFYPSLEKFVHIANNPGWKHRISEVGCILKDKKNNYWIGTRIGLFRIPAHKIGKQLTDDDIEQFINKPGDSNSLAGNYVISLFEDSSGEIWVGTYGNGICKIEYDKNAVKFKTYTDKDGLANNVVYAILEDHAQNLWLSTDNGLSRFDKSETFKNFYITDGLQSNQFYWSAASKGVDGTLYFGSVKGLNFFTPKDITDYPFDSKVVITDLKIFNTSVNIGKWNNKRVILSKAISETESIKLTYKENVFSFEFSALDYFLPDKIEYAYKMAGVDNDWVYVPSSRRFASYTNLQGGDYVFQVKARSSDGVWNDNITRIKITIRPPFYETAWFRIIGIVVIALSVIGYFQVRTHKLKTRKAVLEKMVTDRTKQIEEHKMQLELQNKEISEQRDKLIDLNKRVQLANQLKLRFFTNISHEFRTPLTLILGPLEKLLANWKADDNTRQTLQLINRNAQRLLHLINQLMEFRKIETGKQELKVSCGDITGFVENIYQSFEQLARQRNIHYRFVKENIIDETWFDHDKMENVLFNLLSNAFKYTPEGGSITISIAQVNHLPENINILENEKNKLNNWVEIKVTDSGIGIEKEHLNNIFKRFYRINTPDNLKIKGSGIGLSLTRELIRAHRGYISVESEVGKGSVFTIQLPCSKNSYSPEEIMETLLETRKNFSPQIDVLSEELKNEHVSPTRQIVEKKGNKDVLLIVEDNYDLRSFMVASLCDGYIIHEAENGKQGLEVAKTVSPNLIISDIMMPEMDGLELCTRLKENIHTSHIPVILLTARSSVDNWIEGFETGADDYVAKPFNFDILKARIVNLIEKRRELKRLYSKDFTIDPSKIVTTTADEQFLKKAIEIVEEQYSDPEFGVERFIDKMAVSRSLLHKKLSALTDQSAGDFITSIRLKKSVMLLHARQGNISEIAYQVGFNDPKYFSRTFKKHFGVTPSEYFNSLENQVRS